MSAPLDWDPTARGSYGLMTSIWSEFFSCWPSIMYIAIMAQDGILTRYLDITRPEKLLASDRAEQLYHQTWEEILAVLEKRVDFRLV